MHPASNHVLCSVGDDRLVAFWDIRENQRGPVTRVDEAHTSDINCCAWNSVETNYVLTGSSDATTHLYVGSSVHALYVHTYHLLLQLLSLLLFCLLYTSPSPRDRG